MLVERSPVVVRASLALFTVCWAIFAVGNAAAEKSWTSPIAALLAGFAAICTGTLTVRQPSKWAFRLGGTLGVGSIAFRIGTLILKIGEITADSIVISIAVNAMFLALYWQWWLNIVGTWHVRCVEALARKSEPHDLG